MLIVKSWKMSLLSAENSWFLWTSPQAITFDVWQKAFLCFRLNCMNIMRLKAFFHLEWCELKKILKDKCTRIESKWKEKKFKRIRNSPPPLFQSVKYQILTEITFNGNIVRQFVSFIQPFTWKIWTRTSKCLRLYLDWSTMLCIHEQNPATK